jgi:hypothetical protein
MLRVLHDVASATDDVDIRARLKARADRVLEGCRSRLDEHALARLRARLETVHAAV